MEREVSSVKWARLLSKNQTREIVMDSDCDENYYTSEDTEDEEDPLPPSRRSSISQPPSPDFSANSSEDEDDVGNLAGQQQQPSLWTLSPKPRRRLMHTFIGAPMGKALKLRFWRIITVTWGILTMLTGRPVATRPAVGHGSGQRNSFSTCWI